MGYKIHYASPSVSGKEQNSTALRLRIFTAVFMLIGCLTARLVSPEGCELLRSVLVPGEPTVTEQAFLQMMDNLHCGEPIGESVSAFCRTIVANETEIMPQA